MSLTYGYDLKEGDKILEAPNQISGILSPLLLPGAALVNHLPFCALYFTPRYASSASQLFQCGTFLHGSRSSATNHWLEKLGS
jgi:hypothetical protein